LALRRASYGRSTYAWFAKIQRDVIARGVLTSVADLVRKLRKYIRAYAKSAKRFRWTYTDPGVESVLTKSPGQLTSFEIGKKTLNP
jgi:hypothetical protein